VVLAGPLANGLFAVLAYMGMYMVGVSGLAPVVGSVTPGSIAAEAGLAPGMRIVTVDGQPAPTWDAFLHSTLKRAVEQRVLSVTVRDAHGAETAHALDLRSIEVDDLSDGNLFPRIGAEPERLHVPARIGELESDGPAMRAGFQSGDRVLAVDGAEVADWEDWARYVRMRPQQPIMVALERAGARIEIEVMPVLVTEGGESFGRVGARVDVSAVVDTRETGIERYGMLEAIPHAVRKSWDMSQLTLRIIGKMVTFEASVKNLSGPISIAKFAGQSADLGIARFLEFLGMVSVSLFVLNLLPIPLLDGGHLMYYLIELVTRRPVSENLQAYGQQLGLVLLLGLMGLAFYNDLMRIL
jgi:regulator of sigma E protease